MAFPWMTRQKNKMVNRPFLEILPDSHINIALAYATPQNFTGRPIYKTDAKCFLHPKAAECLQKAVKIAAIQGYSIKIFDAYRPPEVQWVFWGHTPDPDFLADPRRGSPHSRGVAVDLTLCKEGQEVDMGTSFDAFTPLSYHGNTEISAEAQHNRLLLMGIMTTAGWDFYRNEWWHYQLFQSREYTLYCDSEAGTNMITTQISEEAEKVKAQTPQIA